MTRCPRCSEENPDHARFCLSCGLPLERDPRPEGAEERRLVTAVFVDLVGSTAAGELLDPEDVRSRLVPYHSRVRAELERFGGTVEKFIGDAIVALFGVPVANEDDPERAVRAALAVRDAVAELTEADAWLALLVRIGIATGEALVRPWVSESETLAMGDVMNTAARIQGAASPGGILVSDETFRATEHAVEYRPHEPVEAKGKRAPLALWEAVELKEVPLRRHSDSPFVGRRRELAALSHQWRRVRSEGAPATAFLSAEPGTGKTRLVAAFAETLDAPVYWGRCLAYGEGGAYAPAAEILAATDLDQIVEEAPDTERKRTAVASLATVMGSGLDAEAAREVTKGELHWAIRRAFELVADEPMVVVFDDLHWADPNLLELVVALEEADAPMLILGTARPELFDRDAALSRSGGRRLVIELPPLTTAESEELADELLGGEGDAQALAPVLEAAQGNPLFIEESLRMLADEGLLESRREQESLPAPPTLRSMIGARLDRLPEPEKHLALRAAVLGRSFWPGAVECLNGEVGDVAAVLENLAGRDVAEERPTSLVRGEREFAFKHDLIREVAYGRLPKGLRAELHVRCAAWFVGRQERDEFVEVNAYHLEQACRLTQEIERSPVPPPVLEAAAALRAAAEKAERREGLQEADRYYSRALELVVDEEHPQPAAELRLRRARILAALGELEEACRRFRSVAADAETGGWPGIRGEALVGLGNALQKQGRGEEARLALEEARGVADTTGRTKLQVQALFELSSFNRDFTGDLETALAELARALELAAALDDRQLLAEGELRRGFLLASKGELAEAESALARSAELGSQLDSRRDESRATFMRAYIAYHRGRAEEAERLAGEAQEWFERTGDSYFRVQNLRTLATYALARDDIATAELRLREALLLAEPGGGWLVSELNADLAELLVTVGRIDEAEAAAAVALADAPVDDPAARGQACVAVAVVAAERGDRQATLRRVDEALELAAGVGHSLQIVRERIALGRALARVGERDAALEQLRLAGEQSAAIGATTLLATAELALEEIEAAERGG